LALGSDYKLMKLGINDIVRQQLEIAFQIEKRESKLDPRKKMDNTHKRRAVHF
jgi:hypothetical protein